MRRLLFYFGTIILVCSVGHTAVQEDEVGFNMGLLSIYNESGANLDNYTVSATYQINKHKVKPRFDLDYVSIDDYKGVSGLLKGSANMVYEYDNQTNWVPYAVAGVGYEYVDESVEDMFDSHGFIQGGVGVSCKTDNGIKLKAEGKSLQILGPDNQDNELIVTAGLSMPISFFTTNSNECPVKISGPDQDRDGIRDDIDQCPDTPCYFNVDVYGCPVTATLRLNFDVDKATIRVNSMFKVQNFASFLRSNKGTTVVITGHTDSDGGTSYNLDLSSRRANAVLRKLTELGVSTYRLKAVGVGEAQPVATNSTSYGKSRNRRIEVKLIYPNKKVRR